MATSGTVATTTFNTRKVIEHAYARCKLAREKITAELVQTALDALFLGMSNLTNRGVQLWAIEHTILPVYQNSRFVTLPVGTLDVLTHNLRGLTRLTGSATMTASAGTVANATDDDFETSCAAGVNGTITAQWSSDTLVTTVGLLFGAAFTGTLTFQRSADGITWTTVLAVTGVTGVDNAWLWYDLDASLAADYFRVVASLGGTLTIRELFLGGTPTEIQMARLNLDDFSQMPNKAVPGAPYQFYLDRGLPAPIMNLWPAVDVQYRYYQVVVDRTRYLEDVGTLQQEVEVRQAWYDAIVWDLAERINAELSQELTVVDQAWLETRAEKALAVAERGEYDDSPTYYVPGISVYTRA